MASFNYVQFDQRPALRARLHMGSGDAGNAFDLSSNDVYIRAHIRFDGVFLESLLAVKSTGALVGIDRRTGVWEVDTTAPYDVAGAGGIVLFWPGPTTFSLPGTYDVEYEIEWADGSKQTVFKRDLINVREQSA